MNLKNNKYKKIAFKKMFKINLVNAPKIMDDVGAAILEI